MITTAALCAGVAGLEQVARRIANAQQRGLPPHPGDIERVAWLRAEIAKLKAGQFTAPIEAVES